MWLPIRTLALLVVCLLAATRCMHGDDVNRRQVIRESEHLQQSGRLSEAEQLLLHALKDEALPGAEGVASLYNNLGSVLQDQGRFVEADRYYRRAMAEWEKAGQGQGIAAARTLNNLASLLWESGKVAEAERLLRQSANIEIGITGSKHPEAAPLFYNLGTMYFRGKRWPEAESAYRRFLEVRRESTTDRLEAAVCANRLALIYEKWGRQQEADLFFRNARLIWQQVDTANVSSAALLTDLAESFWLGNQQPEAEPTVILALAVAHDRFGPAHPQTARTLTLYSKILRRTNRKTQASAVESRAKALQAADTQLRLSRQTVHVTELARSSVERPALRLDVSIK